MGLTAVVCSFDVPFGVFAFDHAGVGPESSFGEEPAHEFADRVTPEVFVGVGRLRGESSLLGDGPAGDAGGLRRRIFGRDRGLLEGRRRA